MRRTRMYSILSVMTMALYVILTGCSLGSNPTPVPAPKSGTVAVTQSDWQKAWEQLQADGKKEGELVIAGTLGLVQSTLRDAFREKYGIRAEWVSGRITELLPKIQAERNAGLYYEDLMAAGGMFEFRNAGLLEGNLERTLVLPEVTDPKVWRGGSIPFADNGHTILPYASRAVTAIVVNTDLVKPEEMQSFNDLLNPKWKGKIVMDNPTVAGGGSYFFGLYIGEIMGMDFGRQLLKQDVTILNDKRLQVESVARGKYAIALSPDSENVAQFITAGAPIKTVTPKEGLAMGSGPGQIALLKKAPHPAAAKLFINWLLSQEGQTLYCRTAKEESRRLDVSDEWIIPGKALIPGVKYLDADTEEMQTKIQQRQEEAKVFFKDVLAK